LLSPDEDERENNKMFRLRNVRGSLMKVLAGGIHTHSPVLQCHIMSVSLARWLVGRGMREN